LNEIRSQNGTEVEELISASRWSLKARARGLAWDVDFGAFEGKDGTETIKIGEFQLLIS
jgi:hypothetical protein